MSSTGRDHTPVQPSASAPVAAVADKPGTCAYCGLPLPTPLWGRAPAFTAPTEQDATYCCFGCRFAAAVTGARGDEAAARWMLTRLGLAIFLTMHVMVFTLVLWSYDAYRVDDAQALPASLANLLRSACLLVALPVLLLLGQPMLASAWAATKRGTMSSDFLVLAGVAAAYVYSVVAVVRGQRDTYFEVGCMVLVMMTLGRWLEAVGKIRAASALDELQRLLPAVVSIQRDGDAQDIPLEAVTAGDVLLVRPGQRFPADGMLLQGAATVDERLITGESWPVTKVAGEAVTGGSLNLDALGRIVVTHNPREGTLARLIAAVHAAREAKGRYQRLADRIAAWFLPVVAIVAVVTLVGHGLSSGWGTGLMASLAVVLVACPCALGLATPLAVWCGLGAAARQRVVFRSGEALERLADIRAVCIDKTGTLTTGQPRLARFHTDGSTDSHEILSRAQRLAETSSHVFCEALRQALSVPSTFPRAAVSRSMPGLGVSGEFCQTDSDTIDDLTALGSERLMVQCRFELPKALQPVLLREKSVGSALVCIGWAGRLRGVFAFEEFLRPEASQAVRACRDLELDVTVLTGDGPARGERVGDELGVAVTANLLPEDKARQVLDLRRKFGCIAMVGDGINDAPALAAADTGVAMGCGTDFTRDSADVCLLDDDLRRFPWAVILARRTVQTIRQNLIWAFGYNSFGVALAAAGWLHPAIAAVLMLLSSVFVIFNSLRLNRIDLDERSSDSARASLGVAATAPLLPTRLPAAAPLVQIGQAEP